LSRHRALPSVRAGDVGAGAVGPAGAPGAWSTVLPSGIKMVCGGRGDGDFADPGTPSAEDASRALADVPWTWLRQVHGSSVVVVQRPGANRGQEADAAVTCCPDAAMVVLTADCAPVGLSSPQGVAGVLHAGWRGLMAGVVGATVAAMRALGASDVYAGLGPCIWPHAYRFSEGDLATVVSAFGPTVRSVDAGGYPALDLPVAVAVALDRAGAALVTKAGICTHCSSDHWSWRARGDSGRQATVVWRPAAGGPGWVGGPGRAG
jgi:copper oxidase (laccase) domain-containing protein